MLLADEVTRRDRQSTLVRAKIAHLEPGMHLDAPARAGCGATANELIPTRSPGGPVRRPPHAEDGNEAGSFDSADLSNLRCLQAPTSRRLPPDPNHSRQMTRNV